jgi:hypothetical protein
MDEGELEKALIPGCTDSRGRSWMPLGDLRIRRLGVRVAPGALENSLAVTGDGACSVLGEGFWQDDLWEQFSRSTFVGSRGCLLTRAICADRVHEPKSALLARSGVSGGSGFGWGLLAYLVRGPEIDRLSLSGAAPWACGI